MDEGKLKELLKNVKNGRLEIEEAVNSLRKLPFEDIGFARIDHHRHIRCGFPEVIYCPGKDTDHIVKIFHRLAETGHNVLATRAEEHIYEAIKNSGIADAEYEKLGRTISLRQQMPKNKPEGYITVVTAGTADIPVAMEAKVTAELCGQNVEFICDVGVAGLHRIVDKIELLQKRQRSHSRCRNGRSTGQCCRRTGILPCHRCTDKYWLWGQLWRRGRPSCNAQFLCQRRNCRQY